MASAPPAVRPAAPPDASTHVHLASLDGLRGVAVLLVVVAHGSIHLLPKEHRLAVGGIGVQIFFVLSGYLITSLLLSERLKHGSVSLTNFYARRALRIWPLYYAVLIFYVLILPGLSGDLVRLITTPNAPDGGYWPYFAFLQNYLIAPEQVRLNLAVFWSLAIEEQYYLVWPLCLIALTHPRLRWRYALPTFLILAMVVSQVVRVITLNGDLPAAGGGVEWMAHTNIVGLAAGSLLAWLWATYPDRRVGGIFGYALAWVLLAILCARYSVWLQQHQWAWNIPRAPFYEGTLVALTATAILDRLVGLRRRARTLSLPPLVYVGKISYGMYLLHPIVLSIVAGLARRQDAGGYDVLAIFILATIVFASVIYYAYERPLLGLKRHFQRS